MVGFAIRLKSHPRPLAIRTNLSLSSSRIFPVLAPDDALFFKFPQIAPDHIPHSADLARHIILRPADARFLIRL